jgi:hypothetical protein
MLQDHFTGPDWDRSLWSYYNMGSPCYQAPERVGDSQLKLYEYDRFNEGNCLISRRFAGRQACVRAVVTGFEDIEDGGACIGFYAGDGSFTGYVVLAAGPDRLEIRVPSGAQRGASFMDEGQPQQVALAGCDYRPHFPMTIELERDGNEYTAILDGKALLRATAHEIAGDARGMVKALARVGERYVPKYALFDMAELTGLAPMAELAGRVLDAGGQAVPSASVHIAGFSEYYALTDHKGGYRLADVPRGEHVLVAAAEGFQFSRCTVCCVSGADNRKDIVLEKETEDTIPRREYNNPSFDRSMNGYLCLNGSWQFQFDPANAGEAQQWYAPDAAPFDKVIRVPFSWASLMGFGEEHLACGDKTHEANTVMNNFNCTGRFGWYRRRFVVPEDFPEYQHIILHIGAATSVTNAWLDGRYLGMRVDEYADLEFDMGPLKPGSEHVLTVKVEYPHNIRAHNMGKQIFWFSSAPGIWQSVWIEPRKAAYIRRISLRPELEFENGAARSARFALDGRVENAEGMRLLVLTYAPNGDLAGKHSFDVAQGAITGQIPIDDPVLWQYREGNLYNFECVLLTGDETMDNVRTYAGLRKVETRWLIGHSPQDTDDVLDQYQYLYLNDRPFYLMGILDQCYNAFGIYTYRALGEEAPYGPRGSIAYDVDRTLAYGYNLSRVHIKENEPLWYHECDRRGLPVWTEHPGNFFATPDDPDWQAAYNRELTGMMRRLHNNPSILIVSSINESWGVEGRHVSTPWKNELRYRFLKESAERAKALSPHVLVCDNSGFGKTGACEINDFHYYPNDHFDAREKWKQLMKDCYPGSIFNYINAAHGPGHIGSAVQTGRPIYISEFLHINGIDMQLRMFEKVAGYLRMNVASHEVENSGPLTADRFERDYGYVDEQMNPLGYDMVNSMDHVVPDLNRITRVRAGEKLPVDVYTSHFAWRSASAPKLFWSLTGIGALGQYKPRMVLGSRPVAFKPFAVEKHSIELEIPQDVRGAYLFFWIEDGGEVLCRNYVQFVIDGAQCPLPEGLRAYPLPPAQYASARFEGYHGHYAQGGCSLLWACSPGSALYEVKWDEPAQRAAIVFEAGARQGIGAVKVTDENRHPSAIDIYMDGRRIGRAEPSDDPCDERGLFTNAALGGTPFNYRRLGRFGYGERFEIPIPGDLLTAGKHTIEFVCDGGGMTLYGQGMGRYGFHPCVVIG